MKRLMSITLALVLCCGALPVFAQNADLDKALEYLKTYKFSESRDPLNVVATAAMDPAQQKQLALRLGELLQGGCSEDAKRFICRQLAVIGTDEVVPALAALLADAEVADQARRALVGIPGEAAAGALRNALKQGDAANKIAIIEAVARRGDVAASADLIGLTSDAEVSVAQAAITALGKIGGGEAIKMVRANRAKAPAALKAAYDDAALLCAENLLDSGDKEEAVAVYTELNGAGEASHIRAAALTGLIHAQPEKASKLVAEGLEDKDLEVARAAASCLRDTALVAGADATDTAAGCLKKAAPERQVMLIDALADRGDASALKEITKAAKSDNEDVRLTAVKALGVLGDAGSLPLLLEAASSKGEMPRVARAALVVLRGEGVNAALVKAAQKDAPEIQAEALRALAERRAVDVKAELMAMATSSSGDARAAVFKSLQVITDESDLKALLTMLESPADADHRDQIEKTILAVCGRIGDENQRVSAVLAALGAAKDPALRLSLVRIAGNLPTTASLAALRGALKDSDAAYRAEAIARLGAWPDSAPLDDLWAVVEAPAAEGEASSALDGYIRLLRGASDRPVKELMTRYTNALAKVQTPDQKKAVLAGVSTLAAPGALAMAEACKADAAVAAEASFAILTIAKAISGAYPEAAKAAVQPFLPEGTDETQRNLANAVVDAVSKYEDYIAAWDMAGPYLEEGKTAGMLFETAFPPETAPESVAWRIMPMALDQERPWVADLGKVVGGSERVVYLRTTVTSPKAQDALLEVGSNDGVKVWLNGEVVDAVNSGRPLEPGQDKVAVKLKEGANVILMAVYQQGGDWGACARLRTPDGGPFEGLKAAVAE